MTTGGVSAGAAARVERLLELLDRLGASMAALEAGPQDFGTGVPLHRAETHALRAIGNKAQLNVTGLAAALGVTKGAASQLASRLARKGLLVKRPSAESGREVILELTPLGRRGYAEHERFHETVLAAVAEHWGAEASGRLDTILPALSETVELIEWFLRRSRET